MRKVTSVAISSKCILFEPSVVVLINDEDVTWAENGYKRRKTERMTPEQGMLIGRKRSERRAKKAIESAAKIEQMREDLSSVIKREPSIVYQYLSDKLKLFSVTRRVTERHFRLLQTALRAQMVLLTSDSGRSNTREKIAFSLREGMIKATKDQRVDLENLGVALVHPPRSLSRI